jgi:hypothetical protein
MYPNHLFQVLKKSTNTHNNFFILAPHPFFAWAFIFNSHNHPKNKNLKFRRTYYHQKTRGIFFAVCTSPLLNIHGLKYNFDIFIEA